jgi:D-inositol-3-phosphate glycosyltransferase
MNVAIRHLCEGLSILGIPTDVFVRRDDPDVPAEEMLAPLSRVVRLPVGPARPIPKGDVADLCDAFAAAVAAHAASERRAYRVIHAHYWLGGLVARRLRQRWGVAWVQSFHTLARTKARAGLPLDMRRSLTEAELVGDADRLVAASVSEAKDLIRLYRAPRTKICVAQPGVDQRLFTRRDPATLSRELGVVGRQVVLFAGRLEPLKGAETLLDAVASLSSRAGFDDLVVLVIGDDSGDGAADSGSERDRLERHAARRGLADRVRFLGAIPHERLGDFYALADVCVVPSRTESFGLVALEAQALGTPVVAAAVGGLREIIDDGVTGVLVEGRDPERYAEAIASVLEDPELRRSMSVEARLRAGRFTWTRAVDRLASIYQQLSARSVDPSGPCGYDDAAETALLEAG